MEFIDKTTASVMFFVILFEVGVVFAFIMCSCNGEMKRKIHPIISAEVICIMYKKTPVLTEEKNPAPTTPIINDGPQLLQKASARSASCFVHFLSVYKSDIILAPIGYPPINPKASAEEKVSFNVKTFLIIPWLFPVLFFNFISNFEMNINGNKQGIIVCPQRESETFTDSAVSFGNNKRPAANKRMKE